MERVEKKFHLNQSRFAGVDLLKLLLGLVGLNLHFWNITRLLKRGKPEQVVKLFLLFRK